MLDEQYSAYAALTLPYESLYVSWHERDLRGNDCSPSELAEHLKALFENTAKLPRIELTDPGVVIGKNTVQSMQAGAFYGYSG
ncbi:MAG: type III pantothenate kinase, partial [Clostridia bacterium]|nr:type III pantothenate kinase [Clostridia bacterium]